MLAPAHLQVQKDDDEDDEEDVPIKPFGKLKQDIDAKGTYGKNKTADSTVPKSFLHVHED